METYRSIDPPAPAGAYRLYSTGLLPFWTGNVLMLAIPAFFVAVGEYLVVALLVPACAALVIYSLSLTTRVRFQKDGIVVDGASAIVPWPERVAVRIRDGRQWGTQYELLLRYPDRTIPLPDVLANEEADVRRLAMRMVAAHQRVVLEE
jgi:hypothetical protein